MGGPSIGAADTRPESPARLYNFTPFGLGQALRRMRWPRARLSPKKLDLPSRGYVATSVARTRPPCLPGRATEARRAGHRRTMQYPAPRGKPWGPQQELPERRHHPFCEQPRRLPRVAAEKLDHEERAPKRHVPADALDHLIRRPPDPVLLESGPHVTAVDAAGALECGAGRRIGVGDDDEALLRDLQRIEVAADLRAASAKRLDRRAKLGLEGGQVVPDVGVAGGDAHQHALAAAADENLGRAHRLRLAHRVAHRYVPALEGDALLRPQPLQRDGRLLERPETVREPREGTPVRLELGREPAGAEPDDRPAARDVVERRDLLREHGRVAEERGRDESSQADASGDRRHGRELGPRLEDRQ